MKKIMCGSMLLCFIVFGGCASTQKRSEMVELKAKVSTLEKQVVNLQKKDDQIEGVLRSQAQQQQDMGRVLSKSEAQPAGAKKRKGSMVASIKDIQTALKNAGYYTGAIDGKLGPQTRDAIIKFQEENDLKVDGIVGKGTWDLLSGYL